MYKKEKVKTIMSKKEDKKTSDVQKNITNAIINHGLKPEHINYSKIIRDGKRNT